MNPEKTIFILKIIFYQSNYQSMQKKLFCQQLEIPAPSPNWSERDLNSSARLLPTMP